MLGDVNEQLIVLCEVSYYVKVMRSSLVVIAEVVTYPARSVNKTRKCRKLENVERFLDQNAIASLILNETWVNVSIWRSGQRLASLRTSDPNGEMIQLLASKKRGDIQRL
jgi:hypothetical protein